MAISNTNVSMTQISDTFGGGRPDSLGEYYEGGRQVPPNAVQPNGIPTSGPISFGDFRRAGPFQRHEVDFEVICGKGVIGTTGLEDRQFQSGFKIAGINNTQYVNNAAWGTMNGAPASLIAQCQSFQYQYWKLVPPRTINYNDKTSAPFEPYNNLALAIRKSNTYGHIGNLNSDLSVQVAYYCSTTNKSGIFNGSADGGNLSAATVQKFAYTAHNGLPYIFLNFSRAFNYNTYPDAFKAGSKLVCKIMGNSS